MSLIVPRTVTVVGRAANESHPLSKFRSERAYVLLGDPGAGKTTAFEKEAEGDPDGLFVTSRVFTRRSIDQHPEWREKTLFVDGLDELRAGSRDARKPIDDVLGRLDRLGHPDFRLSCRSADWLGRNDLKEIVATAGYEKVKILRLDPLGEDDVLQILAHLQVADPNAFLAEARGRGLNGWLGNPHLLELLARAVGTSSDGDWPAGRRATFEKACELSIREYNEEHLAADHNADTVSAERILSAAGHLSALLLLSDTVTVRGEEPDEDGALSLSNVRGVEDAAYGRTLRRALKSPLFVDRPDCGRLPVHRQIAEFLGGRYLAERIGAELPASRVLALMEGFDGVVAPHLRGLAAWLAAFSPETRPRLIGTDPIGTVLYGDVTCFTVPERNRLLTVLEQHPDEIAWEWPEVALRSLLDGATIDVLRGYLGDDDRSAGRQAVVYLLLRASVGAPELLSADMNLQVSIRDASWCEPVRLKALDALLARGQHDPQRTPELMTLLDDLKNGRVEDRDRELLGLMLRDLYPTRISPDQIWDYLLPDEPSLFGLYRMFWRLDLVKKTGDRAPQLADALAQRDGEWLQDPPAQQILGVVLELVHRALQIAGDAATPSTIFSWLRTLDRKIFWGGRYWEGLCRIHEWLAARPYLQKELVLVGLEHYRGHERYALHALATRRIVVGSQTPEGFAEWCLQRAVETDASHHEAAAQLLGWSRPWTNEESGSGLSLSHVRATTADVPRLRDAVERFANPPEFRELSALEATEREAHAEQKKKEDDFVSAARTQIEQLRAATCAPQLLHRIGDAYLQVFGGPHGADPTSRVMQLLGDDAALTEAALVGLGNVVDRDDLPDLREIIRLDEDSRMSYLALPLLAGLDHLGTNALDGRSEAEIARAVALYYLIPCRLYGTEPPPWYDAALRLHREALADALVRVTRSRIRNKKYNRCLWKLSRDPAHRHVARTVVPELWRSFPTRCTEPQVRELRELLRAAVRWRVDGTEAIISERLRADLDIAQRASWLSAGLLLSPEEYVSAVVSFVEDGEEARCQHIVDILASFQRHGWPSPEWETSVLAAMIALVGSRYTPWLDDRAPDDHWMGRDMRSRARQLVHHWLRTLAIRIDAAAGTAFTALSNDPSLEAWGDTLRDSLRTHIVNRRSATFSTPSIDAVESTLAGGPPANAGDLTTLVGIAFEEIGEHLRHGDTDGWRQFWDGPINSADMQPKHENFCRDRLLDALRAKVPPGMDARREGSCAEDKRADIRVSYGGFAIPVEIKRNRHRKLWSAASDQLVAKYARDPESDGYGIYLVLWFGPQGTPLPPSGPRPKTPDELRDRLEANLTDRDRTKVSVVVLDVSRPVAAK